MPLLNSAGADADAVYLGSISVDAVYLGADKVWPTKLEPIVGTWLSAGSKVGPASGTIGHRGGHLYINPTDHDGILHDLLSGHDTDRQFWIGWTVDAVGADGTTDHFVVTANVPSKVVGLTAYARAGAYNGLVHLTLTPP